MTGKEMWDAYIKDNSEVSAEVYEVWAYGAAPDELAQLTVDGIKTATASAYPVYALTGEPIPKVGDFSVILRADGTAACVIRTTKVFVLPFGEVPAEQAWREGEGDRSLAYWRQVHQDFFTEEMKAAGMMFTEDMQVVCEEFEVVFK